MKMPMPISRKQTWWGCCPVILLALLFAGIPAGAKEILPTAARGPVAANWEEALARMRPLPQAKQAEPVDARELKGKVMVGYQGWFAAAGDGSGMGWVHYGDGKFAPGNLTIEAWPDMREAGAEESYPTAFRLKDGSAARVFSSYHPATVDRHFRWMKAHGIDGVFLQRFVAYLRDPRLYDFRTAVTDNVRVSARRHGRTWAMMYDLSGMEPKGGDVERVMEDWKRLVDRMEITRDPGYQRSGGKPLVALWGAGFNDGRQYGVAEVARLVDFLQKDPVYGGNAVMLGVPFGWREGNRDAVSDPALQALCARVEVVSPWSVGRYRNAEEFLRGMERGQRADLRWCAERKVAYLPVIFPGFSWQNLMRQRGNPPGEPIPRGNGDFFWTQGRELIGAGAQMLYVAMFDELDEGTAILKISNEPPASGDHFVTNGSQPEDHYLWLTGRLGKALREGKIPPRQQPARKRGK